MFLFNYVIYNLLFKMSTGKDLGIENQKVEINKETGEVTMKFKLPL